VPTLHVPLTAHSHGQVFDPDVIPALVRTLAHLLKHKDRVAWIASTIRNQSTFDGFLAQLSTHSIICSACLDVHNLVYSSVEIDISVVNTDTGELVCPVSLLQIHA
jgi:hypothetical protein